MKKSVVSIALLICATTATGITIKMGSLAPVGSPWDAALRRLAVEWGQISGGKVELRVYSGGIVGDEPDMVRKIRIGQLGAAAITASTLQDIFSGMKAICYPLLMRSDEEFVNVFSRIAPYCDTQLESRGYKVVMWSYGGWVYYFSRYPIVTPADLKKQKLWVWSGDPDEVQAWQGMGFPVVPLAATDLLTSLQSGMVDVVSTSPLLAASNQWFGIASNMCGMRMSPMLGALIVSTRDWAQIPADLRPRLIEAAQRISDDLTPQIVKADQDAISTMTGYGLKITTVSRAAEAEWQAIFDKGIALLVGKSFDTTTYEMTKSYLDEYLAAHPRPSD
jgi:TRAP-type C4-dicarboxylate transport system substrate-binding protein